MSDLIPQVPGEAAEAVPKAKRASKKVNDHTGKHGLPEAKDVDARTIKRAVLTKEGYVVPIANKKV